MHRVRLVAGELVVELAPSIGGSVATFRTADGIDLFRPLPDGADDSLHAGMFPMVPFANCIRDNCFAFEGATFAVAPNMAGSALNFHGSGWQLPWDLAGHHERCAVLRLDGARVDAVYRFDALQRFELDPSGLSVTLSLTNRGPRRMPFSFGLHPWFPRRASTLLSFAAAAMWTEGEGGVAEQLTDLPSESDYRKTRQVPATRRNNCYVGWDGQASIDWPELGIGLTIDADPVFSHLMFHVPPSGPASFCIEPQSNAPCAFDGLAVDERQPGVFLLAPGETVAGKVRFLIGASALALGLTVRGSYR